MKVGTRHLLSYLCCATMCVKTEVILTTIATTTTTTTTTAAATTADSGLLGQITTFFNMNRYLVSSIFSAIISNLIQIIYSLFQSTKGQLFLFIRTRVVHRLFYNCDRQSTQAQVWSIYHQIIRIRGMRVPSFSMQSLCMSVTSSLELSLAEFKDK